MNNVFGKIIAGLLLLCVYDIENISATSRNTIGLMAPVVNSKTMTAKTLSSLLSADENEIKRNVRIVYQKTLDWDVCKVDRGYFLYRDEKAEFDLKRYSNGESFLEIIFEDDVPCIIDSGVFYKFFCEKLKKC